MAQPEEQLRVNQFALDLIVASYQKGIFSVCWFYTGSIMTTSLHRVTLTSLLNPEAVVCCMAKTSSREQIQVCEHRS